MNQPEFIKLTDEQVQARSRRNVAIALSLVAFIVLVFIVTIANLKRNTEAARLAAEAELIAKGGQTLDPSSKPAPVTIPPQAAQ